MSSRATNGNVTKTRGEDEAGDGEDDLYASRVQRRTEPAVRGEQKHVDETGDHRRDREGQIDQRRQQTLAAKVELGDRPGRGHAEDEVERHRDGGDKKREPDRGERVRFVDRRKIGGNSAAERFHKNREQRQQEKQPDEGKRDRDERDPDDARLFKRTSNGRRRRVGACAHSRFAVHACRRLIAKRTRNEPKSMVSPMAAAPA